MRSHCYSLSPCSIYTNLGEIDGSQRLMITQGANAFIDYGSIHYSPKVDREDTCVRWYLQTNSRGDCTIQSVNLNQ
jgi:hypothetical protein